MATAIIIDDDQDDIELLSEAINETVPDLHYISFTSPRKAIDFLSVPENCPSVIFLDINMPELNGFECLELLRKQSRLSQCIVIVLSTGMSDTIRSALKKSGVQLAYTKPNNFQAYKKILSKVVSVIQPVTDNPNTLQSPS